jgi:hypothetical protein
MRATPNGEIQLELVRPYITTGLWRINVSLSQTAYMTGLSILSKVGSCASGIKFYFNNGSSQTMGTSYGGDSPILHFDSTSNRLANVSSNSGNIIDVLRICTETNKCVINGNIGGKFLNNYVKLYSTWQITAFWGVNVNFYGLDCMANFGIFYTDIIASSSTGESNLTFLGSITCACCNLLLLLLLLLRLCFLFPE